MKKSVFKRDRKKKDNNQVNKDQGKQKTSVFKKDRPPTQAEKEEEIKSLLWKRDQERRSA